MTEKPDGVAMCGLGSAAILPSSVLWEGTNTKPFRCVRGSGIGGEREGASDLACPRPSLRSRRSLPPGPGPLRARGGRRPPVPPHPADAERAPSPRSLHSSPSLRSFTDLGKKSVEALTLEGLRELTTLRGMATGKSLTPLGGGDPAGEDAWAERVSWCQRYLSLLSTFAARTTAAARPSGGGIITLLSDFMDGGDVQKRLRFE